VLVFTSTRDDHERTAADHDDRDHPDPAEAAGERPVGLW
jgi:hypothetical protein